MNSRRSMVSSALLAAAVFGAPLAKAADEAGGIEPDAGTWRTWVISDVRSFRPGAPPDAAASLDEVSQIKALAVERGEAELAQVTFWNSGSPGYRWIQLAQKEVAAHGLGGPAATRAMSLVAAGIHDAIIAAWDAKYTYKRRRPSQLDSSIQPAIPVPNSPSYPSEHTAAAGVASNILSYLFPERGEIFDCMAANASQSRVFAGTEFPSDVSAGTALGKSVADAVIARAKGDGSGVAFTGLFPPVTGRWSSANPSFPLAGSWQPWALTSGSQFRLAPPPPFESAGFTAQVDAVRNLAHSANENRTAWVWQASFIDPWIDTLNRYLFETRVEDDPPKAAQAYALMLVAQHDATIGCWDTKYAFLELRPIQADPGITPLFATPAHPGYPSGHACASAAAGGVLAALFPQDAQYFADQARTAGLSTFYAGIHYPNDVDQGLVLGRNVAVAVLDRGGITNPGGADMQSAAPDVQQERRGMHVQTGAR